MSDVSATQKQEPTDQQTQIQVLAENSDRLSEVAFAAGALIDEIRNPIVKAEIISSFRKSAGNKDPIIDAIDEELKEPFSKLAYIGATAIKAERQTRALFPEDIEKLENAGNAIQEAINTLEQFSSDQFTYAVPLPHKDNAAIAKMQRVLKEVQSQLDNAELIDLRSKKTDFVERIDSERKDRAVNPDETLGR